MPTPSAATSDARLTTALVNDFLVQTRGAIAAGQSDVDLSAFEQVDSAAIAALLALRRDPSGGGLRFLNPSDNLRKLAVLYGVEALLFPA